jgi:hypothetical protein
VSRNGFDITLGGRSIHMVELTAAEILVANGAGGASDGADAVFASKLAALQMAIRQVDGTPTTFTSLQGRAWDARFAIGQTFGLMSVFDQIHAATADEVAAVANAAIVTEGPDGTTTAVKLGDKTVVLCVLPASRFQATMATAGKQTSALARQYMTILDGVRRSIVTLDGVTPEWTGDWAQGWPFSPKETAILGSIWQDLHGLTEADSARPTLVASTR